MFFSLININLNWNMKLIYRRELPKKGEEHEQFADLRGGDGLGK